MSFKSKLRVLTVGLILQAGVFVHCPMRPEQIEEVMRQMNQPKLAHVLPSDEDDGDGPDPSEVFERTCRHLLHASRGRASTARRQRSRNRGGVVWATAWAIDAVRDNLLIKRRSDDLIH